MERHESSCNTGRASPESHRFTAARELQGSPPAERGTERRWREVTEPRLRLHQQRQEEAELLNMLWRWQSRRGGWMQSLLTDASLPAPPHPGPPVKGSSELLEASMPVVDARREVSAGEGWTGNGWHGNRARDRAGLMTVLSADKCHSLSQIKDAHHHHCNPCNAAKL
ncbi:hypothetical protein INR49_027087, partial [Caranx melampygus]